MKKIFVSYSTKDRAWVKDWLMPRLEKAGFGVVIDFRDFAIGLPVMDNIESAIMECDKTLMVMTKNWSLGEWTGLEALILRTLDPSGRKHKVLPLMMEKDLTLPTWLSMLTFADFSDENSRQECFENLIRQLKPSVSPSNSPPELRISLSLPTVSPDLFGRETELAMLNHAWENPHTRIVVLCAMGGVGKTALVSNWLAEMSLAGFHGAQQVYGWSFYSQGAAEGKQASADKFVADALAWFGDADPMQGSPTDKGRRLAELIRKHKTLLILDGLEPLQHLPGIMEGKLKDGAISRMLKDLALQNPGLCVITTRIPVGDLENFRNTSVLHRDLDNLSEPAGIMLLKSLGVAKGLESDFEEAVKEVDGHALALTLLGTFLKTFHKGDVRKRDKIEKLASDKKKAGLHARRVMESYEKWLEQTPEGRQSLSILRIMGLFDRPAPVGAIAAVREEPEIAGLTSDLKDISEEDWLLAIENLRTLRLIDAEDKECRDSLDCHPLVREHFGQKMKAGNPESWKQAHSRLYEYYKKLPEKHLPDTLEEMQPLFSAVAHGCEAGRHQEALDVYYSRIQREGSRNYCCNNLGAFGSDLSAVSNFFDTLWTHPAKGLADKAKPAVLNWAGFRLRALGRMREATQPMQANLTIRINEENLKSSAIAASNLSELYLTIGEVRHAMNYARQSVEFADKSGDQFWRMGARTTLGDALHQAGELKEALEMFEAAEAMQKESQPEYLFLYSLQGFQFCDLLLSQRKVEEVLKRTSQTLEWVTRQNWLLDIALDKLSIGRAYLLQAQYKEADKWLNEAVEGLRKAGFQDYLLCGLLARAELIRLTKNFARAYADIREATEIAEAGDMGLYMTDIHLETCRIIKAEIAAGDGSDEKQAQFEDHKRKAAELIEKTGYFRRKPELAKL